MKAAVEKLKNYENLSEQEAENLLIHIFKDACDPDDVTEFLKIYEEKPYSVQECLGFLTAMRVRAVPIFRESTESLMDVCGTGGSQKDRFNISTCVAFVLAALDVPVAKHGNYGSSKPNGSFNFLEEMHVNYDVQPSVINELLEQAKCCFLFARKFYPDMRKMAEARRELGRPSVFNYLGPLANPLGVHYQLIGLSDMKHISMLVELVQKLPLKRVLFCCGGDGRDEVSLEGTTQCVLVEPNTVHKFEFNFKSEIADIDPTYSCGNSMENAMLFLKIIIDEEWNHPVVSHIAVNAGAALYCRGKVASIKDGYDQAMEVFRSGDITMSINRYKRVVANCLVLPFEETSEPQTI